MWRGLRRLFERRRRARRWRGRAVALLDDLFADPRRLAGSSLRPSHRRRVDRIDAEVQQGQLVAVRFAILRHPQPCPFSRQFHEVMEYSRFDLEDGTITVERSVNLTRARGEDA